MNQNDFVIIGRNIQLQKLFVCLFVCFLVTDFAWLESMAISMNGVFQFSWNWEVGWGFQRSLQQEMKLDLQEGNFTELLGCANMRSLLMKTWWNWRPREEMKKEEEEVTEELKRFMIQEWQGDFLHLRRYCYFEAQDQNIEWYTKVTAAVQNAI